MSKFERITTIAEYIKLIKKEYSKEGCSSIRNIYYRGQSQKQYKLNPKLYRKIEGHAEEAESYSICEKEICNQVKLEYADFFGDCDNSIDELALMQHYGVPTRLLDVTENPLVALYFACENNKKTDGEVFVLKQDLSTKQYTSYDYDKLKSEKELVFLRAKNYSIRQKEQHGVYIWFPHDSEIKEIDKNNSPIISRIITIPSECKGELLADLGLLGINERFIYPDNMDKCCSELVQEITRNAYSC